MKHFTFRWLKRIYILIAIKLVLLAVLLTSARIIFISIDDYKEQAIEWLTDEYQVNFSVEGISAGIDFSGMVLTLNNVALLDSDEMPFDLNFEYLFLHLDFWDSVTDRQLSFDRISLQGADLTIKPLLENNTSKKSQLTINTLKDIFLEQLKKVSIKDSKINFTDQLGLQKVIIIDQVRWLNEGDNHQGIGNATLPGTLGINSLKFVVDLLPETSDSPLSGNLYLQADNLNVTDYLIKQVNPNAEVIEAVVGFEAWVKFSGDKVNSAQLQLKNSLFSWSLVDSYHSWALKSGLLQVTNSDEGWLLDSYQLDISHNQSELGQLTLSGKGDKSHLLINIEGLTIKDTLPFYLLYSNLETPQISALKKYDLDANIEQVGLFTNTQGDYQFSFALSEFKNRPVGAIPGLSHANITLIGDFEKGNVDIRLPKQKIYFDGQFSRPMPVKSADIAIQWLQTETGLRLSSEQSLLTTDDLDTISQFSLLLPNDKAQNKSAFLSLYSYASLNDASNAQYYFPKKAMGGSVFNYLEPTIKKGRVKGAKILWYGAFSHYPYSENNGIFQAWVPLRDAEYDFYGEWEGLTNLDLDLLFENDYLLMDAKKASLREVVIGKLSAKVDHLNPGGILTIKADITENAQKINQYLKDSPLKNSVGKALSVIDITEQLTGSLILTIPFNDEEHQTKSEGEVFLDNNNIDIYLADDLVMPLKHVNGSFSFINGNLTATNLDALLFEQPVGIAFTSIAEKKNYQIDAKINGIWKLAKLSNYHELLKPFKVSGLLDWSGRVRFINKLTGGYQFDIELNSATQGVLSHLPEPLYKNELQSWPTKIKLSGGDNSSHFEVSINDKLAIDGMVEYTEYAKSIPYFTLNVGQSKIENVDQTKHVVNINLDQLNVATWYEYWRNEQTNKDKLARFPKDEVVSDDETIITEEIVNANSLFYLDEINIDVKHLNLFNQPLTTFTAKANNIDGRWEAKLASDKLQTAIAYRPGNPVRFDINAEKINFQELDLSLLNFNSETLGELRAPSENLRVEYPEVFVDCKSCMYKDVNLSPLSVHVYPTKKRLNIDYIKIGNESESTELSGFWDQRITNIIFGSEGNENGSLVNRFGYSSPVYHQKAQVSGALNWVGAPWEANFDSLNGAFSAILTDGAITEVSDNGARFLGIFSLDGIRRSLNLEFDNVFAKGFNFDQITLSGNINDGVISNDDFYLNGAAGKITGSGLIDLPNQLTNYKFSYSPAVTSSLPVLAAFAINPLTGAAVLMLSKILEPVVETIIRVDFTVKGDLTDPEVKLVTRQRGKVKLENSNVLKTMSEQQYQPQGGK